MEREEAKLQREEEETFRQIRALRRLEEEAVSKMLRLRKLQQSLKIRAREMTRRGLQTLDELDAQEEKEKKDEKKKDDRIQMELAATRVVPELSSEELLAFESSLWGLMSGGGEMPPVSQGSQG
jgi:hypothetical protein